MQYTNQTLTTHNGEITVSNPQTGGHRTFKIATVRGGNLEGKRIASLLDGPDNTSDYTGFGFVTDHGIKVWRKKSGGVFDTYADMIANPDRWIAKGVEYQFSERCRACNRLLTDPESIALGIGPVCRENM